MKRLALLLAIAMSAGMSATPALADTLADQVKAEAARLLTQVSAADTAARTRPAAKPEAVSPALASDLQRFALAASRLSTEIDQRGGPTDLRCIFRGMAEETDKQLTAAGVATNGAEQSRALARLTHMLKDAIEIAPAVGSLPPAKSVAAKPGAAKQTQCPVTRDF